MQQQLAQKQQELHQSLNLLYNLLTGMTQLCVGVATLVELQTAALSAAVSETLQVW